MAILITGATGTVSTALLASIRELAPAADLRLLIRDPARAAALAGPVLGADDVGGHGSVDVVVGDLDDPTALVRACAGVDTVWLLTAMGPQAPHASSNVVWAARQAGVRHVVRLSAIGAGRDAPTRNGRLHGLSDAELMASGLGWTILRPHFFAQNLLGSVIGAALYAPLGDGRIAPVDVRDIADVAAQVLTDPDRHASRTYTLTGPESLSMHDVAGVVSETLGTPLSYQPVEAADAAAAMAAAGMSPWVSAVNLEYADAYARGWGDLTTTDVDTVLGRPARSIADFARDHAPRFRAAA